MQETQIWSLGWEEKEMAAYPHCSCLENSMDRGAWQATVHDGVTKSWTWLSDWTHIQNNYAERKKPDQKSIYTVWFHF